MSFFTPFAFRSGVISGYDPDAQAFIDVTGITGTDADAINNLVLDLKANSLWTKMKIIYPMVGGTADTCKYNLINPQNTDAAYRITWSGSNTFNANGVTFGGTTADYGTPHFIPSGSGISLDSGHISYYNRASNPFPGAATLAGYFGVRDNSAPANSEQIFFTNATASFSSWGGANVSRGTLSGFTGLVCVSRTSATLEETSRNGTVELTYTVTSVALSELEILIGARNSATTGITVNSPTVTNCAFASIGDGLSSSEVSTFYTIVQDYQTALSRQV